MTSQYEIEVEGRLGAEMTAWLGGRSLTSATLRGNPSSTCITVQVPDQAALRGVLNRLWDLNLTLTGVRFIACLPDKETDDEC